MAKRVPPKQRGLKQNQPAVIATVVENHARAWDLFKANMTFRQIAEAMGVSVSTAHGYVDDTLREMREHTALSAQDYADVQHAQIIDLMRGLWVKGISGDVDAVYAIKALMERDAKLLGYDATTKVGLEYLDQLNREAARALGYDEEEAVRLGRTIYMSQNTDGGYE